MSAVARASLAFVRHPWPFPSALSLFACTARVNVMSPQEIASLFTSRRGRLPLLTERLAVLHQEPEGSSIAKVMHLSSAEVRLAFEASAWWPGALRDQRPQYAEPVRFCLKCAAQGFHSHLLNLPWLERCPVHGEPLVSACPHCGGGLLPGMWPMEVWNAFTCRQCGKDFARLYDIVVATRGAVFSRWHEVVAAHFRWCRQISAAFAFRPTPPDGDLESATRVLLELIGASGVQWPRELAAYVKQTGLPGGIRIVVPDAHNEVALELDRLFATHWYDPSIGKGRYFPCSVEQSRWLLNLDGRIQDSSGEREPRRVRDRHYYPRRWANSELSERQRDKIDRPPFEYGFRRPWPKSVRGQGYRRRCELIHVGTSPVHGRSCLAALPGDLTTLGCIRLLAGVSDLQEAASRKGSQSIRQILEWWYMHLMALVLSEGFIAAAHKVAWLSADKGQAPDLVLGWPTVNLARRRPGRAWVLAAVCKEDQLVAYLMPAELRLGKFGEFQREREVALMYIRLREASAWLSANGTATV